MCKKRVSLFLSERKTTLTSAREKFGTHYGAHYRIHYRSKCGVENNLCDCWHTSYTVIYHCQRDTALRDRRSVSRGDAKSDDNDDESAGRNSANDPRTFSEILEVSSKSLATRDVSLETPTCFLPKYPVANGKCVPDKYTRRVPISSWCNIERAAGILEYLAEYLGAITNKPRFALRISFFVCGFLRWRYVSNINKV